MLLLENDLAGLIRFIGLFVIKLRVTPSKYLVSSFRTA